MKTRKMNSLGMILFFAITIYSANAANSFQYISPKPNSILVSAETNIILQNANDVNPSTVDPNLISVVGSESGTHTGELLLSDDHKTIVFNPHIPFSSDEVVNVTVQEGIKTVDGTVFSGYSFKFNIAPEIKTINNGYGTDDDIYLSGNQSSNEKEKYQSTAALPAPPIQIDSVNDPAPGHIFMATWDRNIPHVYGNYIFILDESGQIVDSVRVNGAPFDFKVQPNGLLSYALGDFSGKVPGAEDELRHIVLDSTLAVVDSFKMKNGYLTDFHEFLMLPNGHVMMMSYHNVIYDMSTMVPGGKTDATLVINIIQEQDRDKNVVFEWRNIDYIPIEDTDLDLTDSRINYGTLNAFDIDDDGNILASFRNHSEIMKISRETGEVMWRWGSDRGGITFVGEHEENAPYYFARQHDIRRLDNGNVSLFDNGQFHTPPYSRAVEYTLDEVNMKATMVSEFVYPTGNIFAAAAGNAQKLPGEGWFVGYGILAPNSQVKRNVVEYKDDGSIALELSLPNNVIAYRSFKMPWKNSVHKPSVSHLEVAGGNSYIFNNSTDTTGITIDYLDLAGDVYNTATITRLPYGPVDPQFSEYLPIVYPVSFRYEGAAIVSQDYELHIDLSIYPEIKNPHMTSVYWRQSPDQGYFSKLTTTYDSLANELIVMATDFGEFVFAETGIFYSVQIPIPYEPVNGEKVLAQDPLAVRWTGKGSYDMFQVQISTDSTFSTILTDSTTNSSFVWLDSLTNGSTYFWRVRAVLGLDESSWSDVWRFNSTDAFISIVSPNGGEELFQGESIVIRWETNIADSVKIHLYRNEQKVDTVGYALGSVNAYTWEIPADLEPDSSYKIQVISMKDSSIYDISDSAFSLTSTTGIERINLETPDRFSLSQNYPNPFQLNTRIKFSIPTHLNVKIDVYNTIGQIVGQWAEDNLQAGSHEFEFNASHLPNGVYFYRLQAGEYVGVKKMILRR